MPRKGQSLAARLRATLNAEAEAAAQADKAREARRELARAARTALFADLMEFGSAVGHLAVEQEEEGCTLRRGEGWLRFAPIGEEGLVQVTFEGSGEGHRLYRESQLHDKWAWRFPRHGREERLLFWDTGLEELLALALGIRPAEGIDASEEAASIEGDGGTGGSSGGSGVGGRSL